ncbi:MAG: FAD-dependent oxidoreductase [Anaerolineales bacterium]|jgi:glycine/D-amino acid oxidase-like deaminating enzyme
MSSRFDVVVIGGGIFGVTSALELNRRGYCVALVDQGTVPHPLASSTDISKVVRLEYGGDEAYTRHAENSREGWLRWNEELGEELYHEVGIVMVTRTPMAPGVFEYENYHSLRERGHPIERLDSQSIAERFPAFNPEVFVEGHYSPHGGYAESGRVVATLAARARTEGIRMMTGELVSSIRIQSGKVLGVGTANGVSIDSEWVVVAAGAWTISLLPELRPAMRSVGLPVYHLKPADPSLFQPPKLPVFSVDVSQTGWYGFPLHPREGVLKIAHHGQGVPVDPVEDERRVREGEIEKLRQMLVSFMPKLSDAPIVYTRRCLYCDTFDEHFWIDRHPQTKGLIVAAGGSGHAFKFAPLLGAWVGDTLEGILNPDLDRFRWREAPPDAIGEEASRYREEL